MNYPVSAPVNMSGPVYIEPRLIRGINTIGLYTFIRKEIARFMKVWLQTVLAPVITTVLFFLIFVLALGHDNEAVAGVPYLSFLIPGLIMMSMVQNAFANTSSSVVIAKVQGNIVDVLMPPLSPLEILIGYAVGGMVRGIVVGAACLVVMAVFVPISIYSWPVMLLSAFLSSLMLSLIGIAGGLWSEKFDHMATITNFIVTPLSFLSGTFYSLSRLPELWREIALYNPFFHMIDSFRYGMIGHADAPLMTGLLMLVAINLALCALCYRMLKTGYKIKA